MNTGLRSQAARQICLRFECLSMEREVRNILQRTLAADAAQIDGPSFAQRINQRFKGLEGDDLVLPERTPARDAPDLSHESGIFA